MMEDESGYSGIFYVMLILGIIGVFGFFVVGAGAAGGCNGASLPCQRRRLLSCRHARNERIGQTV